MRRVIPITEQFPHFVEDLRGGFWGDVYGKTRQYWSRAPELESARLRDGHMNCDVYERNKRRQDYRNGFYLRSFQTRLGELRIKIAAHTQTSLSPVADSFVSTASRGSPAADPRSVPARPVDSSGRTRGSQHRLGSAECTDRLARLTQPRFHGPGLSPTTLAG